MSLFALIVGLALFVSFLVLLGFLAAAATKAVPKAGEDGRRGFLGGCALACLMVFIGGVALFALLVFGVFVMASSALSTARELMELNPIEWVRVVHDHQDGPNDLVRISFEVRGESGRSIGDQIVELVREVCHDEKVPLIVWPAPAADAEGLVGYELELEIDDRFCSRRA